jgi:hypothetical protein
MNSLLSTIQEKLYNPCSLLITKLEIEQEGKEYHACHFQLNDYSIICRNAKVTPKKAGQFVTFWKRDSNGTTTPFDENDAFDFYVINVNDSNGIGQFVFPKSVLIEKGITTTSKKDGKRGFRVYPSWDKVSSKQAIKTQQWQLNYFIAIDPNLDLETVKDRYRI